MATDGEVIAAQDEVAKLRAELQSLRLGGVHDTLREASNEITVANLAVEAATLQRKIDEAKESSKKSSVAAGTSAPLAAAKADLAVAVAAQKAAAKPATRNGEGGK